MIPRWCTQTIIRIRPGEKVLRGSKVPDWDNNTDLLEICGCSVQPATTGLSQDGRVLGISDGFTVYLPEDSDVQAGDRIEFEGNVYTINGDPKIWPSATGRVSHMQLNIERWRG